MADAEQGQQFDPLGHAIAAGMEEHLGQAWMLLGELKQLTRWQEEVLLRRLGCDLKARTDRVEADDTLQHSVSFLGWVVKLASHVDQVQDARQVVIGAYELSLGAGGSLEDRVNRCEAAFLSRKGAKYSAMDYLKLGEVQTAWRTASLHLDSGTAKARVDRTRRLTGPFDSYRPHINPRRLRQLYGPDPQGSLGRKVSAEMVKHVALCATCKQASEQLRGPEIAQPAPTALAG